MEQISEGGVEGLLSKEKSLPATVHVLNTDQVQERGKNPGKCHPVVQSVAFNL